MEQADYTIDYQRESWKSARITYREGGRSLECYVEWDGSPAGRLVGCSEDLMIWAVPEQTPVSYEKYCMICDGVWVGDADLSPPLSLAQYKEELRRRGRQESSSEG